MAMTPFGILIRYKKGPIATPASDEPLIAELHTNLWELKDSQFLDIGIMVNLESSIDKIVIQVPWTASRKNIGDLGGRLIDNTPLIAAVFNEDYTTNIDPSGKFCVCSNSKKTFSIVKLTTHEFDVMPNESCGIAVTDIELECPANPTNKGEHYFRFRIQGIPKAFYANEFKQGDRFLLSSWTDTQLLDFRINVKRGVPNQLISSPGLNWFKFSRIHFFLLKNKSHDPFFQDANYIGCRSLEDEGIWNNYVQFQPLENSNKTSPNNFNASDCLAYQWTKKQTDKTVTDLTILARFRTEVAGWKQLFLFSLFVLTFGALGSGTWNYLHDNFQIDNPFYTLLIVFIILYGSTKLFSKK